MDIEACGVRYCHLTCYARMCSTDELEQTLGNRLMMNCSTRWKSKQIPAITSPSRIGQNMPAGNCFLIVIMRSIQDISEIQLARFECLLPSPGISGREFLTGDSQKPCLESARHFIAAEHQRLLVIWVLWNVTPKAGCRLTPKSGVLSETARAAVPFKSPSSIEGYR
jgi:hypothetical protein